MRYWEEKFTILRTLNFHNKREEYKRVQNAMLLHKYKNWEILKAKCAVKEFFLRALKIFLHIWIITKSDKFCASHFQSTEIQNYNTGWSIKIHRKIPNRLSTQYRVQLTTVATFWRPVAPGTEVVYKRKILKEEKKIRKHAFDKEKKVRFKK